MCIRDRGYLALALIDNAEWLRWEDIGAEGETPVSGTVYAGDYVAADYNAVRGPSLIHILALRQVLLHRHGEFQVLRPALPAAAHYQAHLRAVRVLPRYHLVLVPGLVLRCV